VVRPEYRALRRAPGRRRSLSPGPEARHRGRGQGRLPGSLRDPFPRTSFRDRFRREAFAHAGAQPARRGTRRLPGGGGRLLRHERHESSQRGRPGSSREPGRGPVASPEALRRSRGAWSRRARRADRRGRRARRLREPGSDARSVPYRAPKRFSHGDRTQHRRRSQNVRPSDEGNAVPGGRGSGRIADGQRKGQGDVRSARPAAEGEARGASSRRSGRGRTGPARFRSRNRGAQPSDGNPPRRARRDARARPGSGPHRPREIHARRCYASSPIPRSSDSAGQRDSGADHGLRARHGAPDRRNGRPPRGQGKSAFRPRGPCCHRAFRALGRRHSPYRKPRHF